MPGSRRIGPGFAHGIVFHRFAAVGDRHAPQGAVTPTQLESLLRFIGIDRILAPEEWMTRLERDALGADDLCLTFDDGLLSQKEYALPVLDRLGLRAFFFVCSGVYAGHPIRSEVYSQSAARAGGMASVMAAFLERCPATVRSRLATAEFRDYVGEMRQFAAWYSEQDLEYRFLRNRVLGAVEFQALVDRILRDRGVDPDALARSLWLAEADLVLLTDSGHYVGLHSWDHPYELERLPAAAQHQQYERNRAHLERVTGRAPAAVAHPLNSYSDRTLALLRGLGVSCGFRANAVPPRGRPINPGPLELAREDAANVLLEMERTQ